MSVTYEAPTIKESDRPIRNNEKIYNHPAYGVIGMSRITCRDVQLFGSNVKHDNLISLRIQTAERSSNGDYEFIFPRKRIIEVWISGNQLGQMLSSMNVGEGVPCTIRHTETNYDVPMIKDESTPIEESRKSLQDRINKIMEQTDRMIKTSQEVLDNPKPMSKKDMKVLHDRLTMIKQNIHENLPFVAKCFDEKMDKTVTDAKCEVEAFITSTIHKAGMDAIAGKFNVAIPYDENIIEIEEK